MIDVQLIESARMIRKKFLKLTKEINLYQDEVKNLVKFLQEKMKALEEYRDKEVKKIKTKEDVPIVAKEILKEVEEIEVAELQLQKKLKKVNEEMEKLSKYEEILYQTLKNRYPELSDTELKNEIQKYLDN